MLQAHTQTFALTVQDLERLLAAIRGAIRESITQPVHAALLVSICGGSSISSRVAAFRLSTDWVTYTLETRGPLTFTPLEPVLHTALADAINAALSPPLQRCTRCTTLTVQFAPHGGFDCAIQGLWTQLIGASD
jgi:hypothetical protein